MQEGVRLAALVGSKVCHEIVGPLTGILHGLELLKESDLAHRNAEALGLLEQGLQKLYAKLNFLRSSFAPNDGNGLTPLHEARRLAEPLYASVKPQLEWRAGDVMLPRTGLRVLMYLLLLATDCLPKGGVVAVETEVEGEQLEVRVTASGQRAMLRPAVLGALTGEAPEGGLQADLVIPALTVLMARQAGYAVFTRISPECVVMGLRLPNPSAV